MKTLFKKYTKKFSEFIRLRDADDLGYAFCCTCEKWLKWQYMDAGHYIAKGNNHSILRWHERNVHAQCPVCNRMKDGNYEKYQDFMVRKYTIGEIGELHMMKNKEQKLTRFELQIKIDHYTELVKELKKQKA